MTDQTRDEDQCPWPGCVLEAGHEGDHEIDTEQDAPSEPMGLVPMETGIAEPMPEAETRRTETIREERFDQADPAVDATVVAMATFNSYSVREASNGANIDAGFAVDAVVASDFEELIGEQVFTMKVGTGRSRQDCGQCTVEKVATTREPGGNKPITKVNVKWAGNQRAKARAVGDFVSAGALRVELWPVQLPIFGSRVE